MAGHTFAFAMRLACTEYCAPTWWPAAAIAFAARVRRHAALRVDDGDLPHVLLRVGRDELRERIGRRDAALQQLEPARAVAGINERLRGDRAYARLGPRDDGSDREPVRLDGHAELAVFGSRATME